MGPNVPALVDSAPPAAAAVRRDVLPEALFVRSFYTGQPGAQACAPGVPAPLPDPKVRHWQGDRLNGLYCVSHGWNRSRCASQRRGPDLLTRIFNPEGIVSSSPAVAGLRACELPWENAYTASQP